MSEPMLARAWGGVRRWLTSRTYLRLLMSRAYFRRLPDHMKEALAIVTWKRDQSTDLFFVFAGRGMGLMMEPVTFFRETGLFESNFIMMRDYQRFFYHAGLNRELPDVGAIRDHLLSLRREMPEVTRSFCLGSSMGGYAAILFGHYLKADTVFAFAPQTLIDLPRLQAATGRKDTWRFPEAHRDLALLLAGYNGKTRYKIFYSQDFPEDRDSAERLRGLPGVELCPQPGDGHTVVHEMHKRGRLREVLTDR